MPSMGEHSVSARNGIEKKSHISHQKMALSVSRCWSDPSENRGSVSLKVVLDKTCCALICNFHLKHSIFLLGSAVVFTPGGAY